LRSGLLAVLVCACASLALAQPANAANKVTIGVLKFGTVSWALDTIRANGLDKAEGVELDIVPLASTQATTVGLQAGSVDIIATDWLWVSRERSGGADFTFSPFTTALGSIMVPPNSPIKTLSDLKGKRLALPNSRILIHQPATEGGYGQSSDIEIQAREILRIRALMEQMLAEDTGKSTEEVSRDIERDKYLTAEQALEYGIIDEVLTSLKAVPV